MFMKKIILASQSPRRKQLLSQAGYEFEVYQTDADENITAPNAQMLVKELALIKAAAAAKELEGDYYIIGADTVVCIGERILGKPKNKRQARLMLKLLSGKKHQVYTGVCVFETKSCTAISKCERSDVEFYPLKNKDIRDYVKSGEPMDKAGAYAIQENGRKFVKKTEGEFDNIVGLPLKTLKSILTEFEEDNQERKVR